MSASLTPCGVRDPATGATCLLREPPASHSDHAGFHEGERVFWIEVTKPAVGQKAPGSLQEVAQQIQRIERQSARVRKAAHPTEVAAAVLASIRASDRRKQVLGAIILLGTATDDEVSVFLQDPVMSPPRVASRRGELVEWGVVVPVVQGESMATRPTRTGAEAIVWTIPDVVKGQLRESRALE